MQGTLAHRETALCTLAADEYAGLRVWIIQSSSRAVMGNLEHQFTPEQLAYITRLREKDGQTWKQITSAFNDLYKTRLSIDEIRWAYQNLS
ncbi:MAG: hypothetical protein M1817_001005 [Caeruleum heppii]|nr:MAG: hypothetical protein M1817_001005 [Caeruleum heppii]